MLRLDFYSLQATTKNQSHWRPSSDILFYSSLNFCTFHVKIVLYKYHIKIHFWSGSFFTLCVCVCVHVLFLSRNIEIFVDRNPKRKQQPKFTMSHRPQNPRRMRDNDHHQRQHHNQHNHRHQSMRLQDFLNHRANYQLTNIDRCVCEFSQDRDGSKFIQRKLDEAPDQRKNKIFEEIHAQLHALMMHCFANFVVQKFFTIGNLEQRQRLYAHVKAHFLELSLNKYGCRVVQKAIETAQPYQLAYLLDQFTEGNIMCLVYDANGNHVIQNIICTAENVPNRHIQVRQKQSATLF